MILRKTDRARVAGCATGPVRHELSVGSSHFGEKNDGDVKDPIRERGP